MSILLEDAHLDGRLFDGAWQKSAAPYQVIEPATGDAPGRAGQTGAARIGVTAASALQVMARPAAVPQGGKNPLMGRG